jgi:hypothetical protein
MKSTVSLSYPVVALLIGSLTAVATYAADSDGDAIDDASDNCVLVANPSQYDADADGFGNACDADLNNDLIVNFIDLGLFRAAFFTPLPSADFNEDGVVNFLDLGVIRTGFLQPPGPAAANNPPTLPAPFFRKPADGSPSFAPAWYANKGAVTSEVFYDASVSPEENGNRLEATLEAAAPGEHVLIHGGTYVTNGGRFHLTQRATATNPTVIRGAPGETVIIERQNVQQNLMELSVSYMILENFRFVGGSQGIRFMTADHVMFHNNDVSGSNSSVITANSGETHYMYFIDNEVHHANSHAEGFYLGAHDGSPTIRDCFVVGNYVHDLRGPTVTQGDGIEIKKNAERCLVKWNFVARTNYPGILVYGNGLGLDARITIEENVVVDSNTHGIQAAADAVIRNNLVIAVNGSEAILSVPHNGVQPRNLEVYGNTLISTSRGFKGSSWQTGMVFANNAVYSATGQHYQPGGAAYVAGNVFLDDLSHFQSLTSDGSVLDARPAPGGALIGAATPQYYPSTDLIGRSRTGSREAGAIDAP